MRNHPKKGRNLELLNRFSRFFTMWYTFGRDYRSGHFLDSSRVVAMTTNFRQNWRTGLYLVPWHYKTDWNITIEINIFIVPMIPLRSVQIWWTLQTLKLTAFTVCSGVSKRNAISPYTLCLKKNDNDVLRYNCNTHQPIMIIFGRDIAEWICY